MPVHWRNALKKLFLYCNMLVLTLFAGHCVPLLHAQLPPLLSMQPGGDYPQLKIPSYDVGTVKPHKEDGRISYRMTPDLIDLHGLTLSALLQNAYGFTSSQLLSGGPSWVYSKAFDVTAKLSSEDVENVRKLSPPERQYVLKKMLQAFLAERFGLKVHTEEKTLPVYELTIPGGGSGKLKPSDLPQEQGGSANGPKKQMMFRTARGSLSGVGWTTQMLASSLSSEAGRLVIDKTGYKERFDLDLKWAPEQSGATSEKNGSDASALPDLFTAVQEQLGLKLVSAKDPVKTLVIDTASLPTED